MTKQILFLLMVCITFSCNKKQDQKAVQEEKQELVFLLPPKKIDKNSLIGFACYNSGKKS